MNNSEDIGGYAIAIVGMATRVPGSSNTEEYWHNLKNGVESVEFYSEEQLTSRGVTPDQLKNPQYVKAGCPLQDMDQFDPDFFGFSPKEAGILDPQHRQFYECAWEALEQAGHPPSRFDGAIGVFAGCGTNAYFAQNLITNKDLVDSVGMFLLRHTGNDKDFLSTRVSYNFDLKGPSISVQTACSTSSVATHLACQSLLSEECDMALAGGVTIDIPHGLGYLYKEGEILSPDGHCRPFDHRSKGTIFGSGTGVIVLRRLEDAIADGDHIHSVIIGTAINNDGSSKVGYLAPSVEGQAEAITEALEIADVDADTIGYIECHGTGTPVGDPIEVAALTAAFNQTTDRLGYCGIGSVKSNIGHLDTAAGVAGIVKASLSLENQQIPPSLNYEAPNPTIDFASSPFYVNDTLKDWKADGSPRRAAVNSLGVGGTNAFVILEEAPERAPSDNSGDCALLTFSAKSRKSLDAYGEKLADHLRNNPQIDLADVAYTLFEGREHFEHRRVLAIKDHAEAIDLLESKDQRRVFTHSADDDDKSVVFMFPGGGAQYADMSAGLYETEKVFRQFMDEGFDVLRKKTGLDYKNFLFVQDQVLDEVNQELQKPSVQLPLIFLVEYALAKQWISMGIEPQALIGHSMGENCAACLAGVLNFEDALGLVLLRGQLMDDVPEGGMLSIELSADEIEGYLHEKLAIAAKNSPTLTVVSGTKNDLNELSEKLSANGIENKPVPINIAAHSWLLDGILEPFRKYLNSIVLNKPKIDFVSNYTGTWITDQQAVDPEYWVNHLRNTVRFADGIDTLLEEDGRVFLEVGPGNTLGSLARQNKRVTGQRVFSSLRHPKEETEDDVYFLSVFGRLWGVGLPIGKEEFWPNQVRHRTPLPTYAFNHNSYFIERTEQKHDSGQVFSALDRIEDPDNWYQRPVWIEQGVLAKKKTNQNWLVFLDDAGIGAKMVESLRADGNTVVTVKEADAYYSIGPEEYCLPPESGLEAYSALVKDLVASGKFPDRMLHLWLVTLEESFRPGSSFLHRNQEHGFYSLFFFARAMADEGLVDRALDILVYGNGIQQVAEEDVPYPEKSTVLGPCKVIPREFPKVTVSCFDLMLPETSQTSGLFKKKDSPEIPDYVYPMMENELYAEPQGGVFAYRNGIRWQQTYHHAELAEPSKLADLPIRLREGGLYLITGGLGGIGYALAQQLAAQKNAKLILVNRTPIPAREEWEEWLYEHSHDDKISILIGKVKILEELGADIKFYGADVTDVTRMKEILDEVTLQDGPIQGVVHAAGTINDGLIQTKNQGDIESVFAPKIYGTLVLDELFSDTQLDFFILFSSTSTVTAPVGQMDYVAANDFLNAYARQRNKTAPGYTVAVNWGIWNEVGMAASMAAQMGFESPAITHSIEDARYGLFDKHIRSVDNGLDLHFLTGHLDCTHWLLDEHRTKQGQALLPGTAYIELARAALQECGELETFEIAELVFLKALYVPDDETRQVRVKLEQTVQGYNVFIQSFATDAANNEGWQTHGEAKIVFGSQNVPDKDSLDDVLARLSLDKSDKKTPFIRTGQEDHLNFGQRWHVLREAKYGEQESVARLSLDDEFQDDLDDYKIHPAILDISTGFAMELIEGYSDVPAPGNLWVPVSYGSFNYFKPLKQEVYSWVRNSRPNSVADDFASFDISIYDKNGNVLATIDKLTIKKIEGTPDFSGSNQNLVLEKDLVSQTNQESQFRQLSPAEMAFQHNLANGILPNEGIDALFTILEKGRHSEIIVSSMELDSLIKEIDATAASLHREDEGTKFARPDLDSDYQEPRDDIERTLVGFWEELLGVDQIGIEDNFFDLGGHSLIAVRLFAKVQQTYDVDYPISVLFEAPTISACADMLRNALGDSVKTEASSQDTSQEKSHKPRYTHLVPMHASKSNNLTPFFLVAGMFGNVLNLRHLAQLIGNERPFYGLQARGLYGDQTPHETFEEMARDYIQEMLTVQSEGPFVIGGFSGGGITAYEICRQLKEMGHEVAQLIFLDTPLPYNDPLSSVDRMSIHWQRLKTKGSGYFAEWAKSRYQWELEKFRKRFTPIDEDKSPAEFKSGEIEVAFYDALSKYDIQPLDVNAKLFRPKLPVEYRLSSGRMAREDKQIIMEDNGWPRYIDDLEVFEVPGDHDSMVLEPNVRVLSEKMRKCIDSANAPKK